MKGSPLADSNRRPPPYHALQTATGGNRRQRFWLVFAVSAAIRFATDCHRLQPRGSIKAPSNVVTIGYAGIMVTRPGTLVAVKRRASFRAAGGDLSEPAPVEPAWLRVVRMNRAVGVVACPRLARNRPLIEGRRRDR